MKKLILTAIMLTSIFGVSFSQKNYVGFVKKDGKEVYIELKNGYYRHMQAVEQSRYEKKLENAELRVVSKKEAYIVHEI